MTGRKRKLSCLESGLPIDCRERCKTGVKATTPPAGRSSHSDGCETEECPICLQELSDPAITYPCNHFFDFDCLRRWVDQSQTCPLCKRGVDILIYDLERGTKRRYDVRDSHAAKNVTQATSSMRRARRQEEQRRRFERQTASSRNLSSSSELEREEFIALQRRRFVYQHKLYSSHIGTNSSSNFMPFTTQDIQRNTRNLKSKASMFLRRELKVFDFLWDNAEFTLTFIVDGILTRLDIQAAGSTKLVADLLGMENAGLLLHELRTFLRSPFETVRAFDHSTLIQYAIPIEPSWDQSD